MTEFEVVGVDLAGDLTAAEASESLKEDKPDPAPPMDQRTEAQVMVLNNDLTILRRDNEQLRTQVQEANQAVMEWAEAFGLHDGQSPKAAVEARASEQSQLKARVDELHAALGIGATDDPTEAVGALKARNRLANVDPVSHLPALGHLLLMTRLAKVAGMNEYLGTPDQVRCPTGDIWYSYVEEASDNDGNPIRTVVIRLEPNAYGYAEAQNLKVRLDSEYAQALREQKNAKVGLQQAPADDEEVLSSCRTRLHRADERAKALKDQLDDLEPRLTLQGAQEWRFAAGLHEIQIEEAA